MVGANVYFHPANPGRLYVQKAMAAINGSNPSENTGSLAAGSINEQGDLFLRGVDTLTTAPGERQ